jgi:hypothetical protein
MSEQTMPSNLLPDLLTPAVTANVLQTTEAPWPYGGVRSDTRYLSYASARESSTNWPTSKNSSSSEQSPV